jgi:hypothetical protein
VNAEFNWWLLIVGLVVGAGLVWLVVADTRRREVDVSEAERAGEARWIAETMAAAGRAIGDRDVLDILRTGDQPRDRPQNALPIGQHNFVERGRVAFLSAPDQLEINQHAAPRLGPAPGNRTSSDLKGVPAKRQVTRLWGETQKPRRSRPECEFTGIIHDRTLRR